MKRFKLWNYWRHHNKNGIIHQLNVLFKFVESPSFNQMLRVGMYYDAITTLESLDK